MAGGMGESRMDVHEANATPTFLFDLAGRVRNLSLPASSANALIPLFEAVSNAIHAVEERWLEKSPVDGKIRILLHRRNEEEDAHVIGFSIVDNGIGLTSDNWDSFRTSDSGFKVSRGGKGVGRLSWLKAFSNCNIKSTFEEAGALKQRMFSFNIKGRDPIQEHLVNLLDKPEMRGTEIRMEPFVTSFESHCPKKLATIAAKLVGHFLPYLVVNRLPPITVEDSSGEIVDIRAYYQENQNKNAIDIVLLTPDLIDGPQQFQIYHILLRKQLKFLESGLHWVFYAGNERVAKQTNIDGQLGLKHVGDQQDSVYVCLVTGAYLDAHVNQERTSFTFAPEVSEAIHDMVIASAKEFLSEYIERVRAQQLQVADRVIRENPQFISARENLTQFVTDNLSLNKQGEEDIFLELSRRRLRAKRRLDGQIRSVTEGQDSDLENSIQQITKALNDEKKGSLAEYVVRRKSILDLLDSSLAYKDPATRKYYKEDVIHGLIVPLRSSSEDLDYNDHNLWILDDRLAFYSFFRSDKPFSTFVEGSDSGREPDLTFVFERSLAFRREGRDEPIVIIEFKKPGRDDYNGNTNPVTQALEYVDLFREGKAVKGKDGSLLKPISRSTRFICFIIADFTDTLVKVVRTSPANNPTADGQGYFGISTEHNAVVEVMPYEKVLHDARIRNEAFFVHLGLL
jgi:hypothetical protein